MSDEHDQERDRVDELVDELTDAGAFSTNGRRDAHELEDELDVDTVRQLTLVLRGLEEIDMRLTAVQTELLVCGLALALIALGIWRRSQ